MKKTFKILAAALAFILPLCVVPSVKAESVTVGGGTDRIVFDDSEVRSFDFYEEFNQPMYILQNKLYAPVLTESKAIYKYGIYDNVTVSTDVTSINKNGIIDGGIYIGASGANNSKDGITAWCVNVEHSLESGVYALKLHRFENNRWLGAKKEVFNIKHTSDTVHLSVTVKSGVLYAYTNGERIFSYAVGAARGKVGLRAFYSPIYFENFVVTSPVIAVDRKDLENKLNEFKAFDYSPYTKSSATALADAVKKGEAVLADDKASQSDIDGAYDNIVTAKNRLLRAKTRADLDALVAETQTVISKPDVYTKSSISSLKVVVGKCQTAADEDISYWYNVLRHRLDSAVKYIGEDDE